MWKKLSFVLLALVLISVVAYQNRIQLMLAYVKFQAERAYEVAGPRDVPWRKGPEEAAVAIDQRPPNIILIVADDLGYNDISTFGGGIDNGRVKTPNIDRLAAEGAVFRQSYSGASTCAPSRAMLMTGRYPTRTGFEFTPIPNGMGSIVTRIYNSLETGLPPSLYDAEIDERQPPFAEKGLPSSETTIAEVLKTKGYYTAHIGKWHLGNTGDMPPHRQGFDDSLLMTGGLYLPEDHADVVNTRLPFDPIDQFLWARMTFANTFNSGLEDRFEPKGYMTDYWAEEATKVIKFNRNRPFFLYLAHWGPHTPLQASRADYEAVGDIKPDRKRVYAAMVRSIDRSVGQILETLEDEGLSQNTVVVFTSDNGGAGYLGLPEVNSPFRGWKLSMFEGGIRVPMFVRWPGRVPAGSVVNMPVAHIDVMPTLAAAAGAAMPEGVAIDGRDVLPLLNGDADWTRKTLFWQNGHYQVVRHGDWKLQINDRPVGGMKRWLFDLEKDPTEQNNLAETNPEKVEELAALLAAHHANSHEPLYESTTQVPVMIDKTLDQHFKSGDEYVYTPN